MSPRPRRAGPADPLDLFHPAVASWFRETFPGGPTTAQRGAWPPVEAGENVLLVSPTGTGKTLAAFLVALDAILRRRLAGDTAPRLATLYVSPLKALDNDVHRNLERPRAGIAAHLGTGRVPITTAVRTGDTPARERTTQLKAPPDVLITTPESLYLMLTGSGRRALEGVSTVILDEIHSVAGTKRGSHLALSLERLEEVVARAGGAPPQRIALSATVAPVDVVASFAAGTGRPMRPVVVAAPKSLDLAVTSPAPDFRSLPDGSAWGPAVETVVKEVEARKTTLVFCNNRRLAEKVARKLSDATGTEVLDAPRVGLAAGAREDRAGAQVGRAPRPRGDRLPRARDRRRARRLGRPPREPEGNRARPAARGPLGAPRRRDGARPLRPPLPRRPLRERGDGRGDAGGGRRGDAAARLPPRRPRPAARRGGRRARGGLSRRHRRRALRAREEGVALPRASPLPLPRDARDALGEVPEGALRRARAEARLGPRHRPSHAPPRRPDRRPPRRRDDRRPRHVPRRPARPEDRRRRAGRGVRPRDEGGGRLPPRLARVAGHRDRPQHRRRRGGARAAGAADAVLAGRGARKDGRARGTDRPAEALRRRASRGPRSERGRRGPLRDDPRRDRRDRRQREARGDGVGRPRLGPRRRLRDVPERPRRPLRRRPLALRAGRQPPLVPRPLGGPARGDGGRRRDRRLRRRHPPPDARRGAGGAPRAALAHRPGGGAGKAHRAAPELAHVRGALPRERPAGPPPAAPPERSADALLAPAAQGARPPPDDAFPPRLPRRRRDLPRLPARPLGDGPPSRPPLPDEEGRGRTGRRAAARPVSAGRVAPLQVRRGLHVRVGRPPRRAGPPRRRREPRPPRRGPRREPRRRPPPRGRGGGPGRRDADDAAPDGADGRGAAARHNGKSRPDPIRDPRAGGRGRPRVDRGARGPGIGPAGPDRRGGAAGRGGGAGPLGGARRRGAASRRARPARPRVRRNPRARDRGGGRGALRPGRRTRSSTRSSGCGSRRSS